MVENGHRTLDRRRHIAVISDALKISVSDLTGEPVPPADPAHGGAHESIATVRMALLMTSMEHSDFEPERSVEQLTLDTSRVHDLLQRNDYESVGHELPGLLHDAHAHLDRPASDREAVLRALILVTRAAAVWLKNLGLTDLAWVAAERSYQAGRRLEDPVWLSVARGARLVVLSRLGAYADAGELAIRAADEIPTGTPEGLSMHGTMSLFAAHAAMARDEDPANYVDHAEEVARRTGEGNKFWYMFGPTNVDIWRTTLAVEAGDYPLALEMAERVDVDKIPVPARKAAFLIDYGRALAKSRRDAEAIRALRGAEKMAPDRVRNNTFVRDTVEDLLRRARREAGGGELRGLAHRLGVQH